MRAILLLVSILGASAYAILDARIGIYAYIWFGLMRPDYPAYAAGAYSYSFYLACGTLVGSLRYLENISRAWFTNPYFHSFLLLQIPLFVAGSLTSSRYLLFLRMSLMVILIPLLITTIEDLKRIYLVTAVSLGIWGLWHGATGVLHGGLQIRQGIGGFMSENNTFACGLTMALPFCWYSRTLFQSKWLRMLLLAMVFGSIATVVLTFSRGGALALAFVILLISIQSKRRVLTLTAVIICGLLPAVFLVKDAYFTRMESIANYEEDNSSLSRVHLMKAAVYVWQTHPWFGVGIEDEDFFKVANPFLIEHGYLGVDHVVHNSYLWLLAQCGIFALVAFLYLLLSALLRTWRSYRKMARDHPGLDVFPQTLFQSLVAYMVCSLTQPRATFDFLYIILMYAAAWYVIAQNLPRTSAVPAQAAPAGGAKSLMATQRA